ncbi:MAG: YdcF family protein [Bacteroidetes bacterium]|nr:YdcF family protein [Bacteroidota bacterium]
MSIFLFFRELVKSLLTPLSLVWLLIIAVFVFHLIGKKKIAKWGLGLSLFWFLLISTPFLPKKLLATLENQYPPVKITERKGVQVTSQDSMVHILVLGSGYQMDNRLSYCGQLNTTGLARLTEGIRLHRLLPGSKLIFSGFAGNQLLPEAVVASMAAQELGINPTDIATNSDQQRTMEHQV